MAIAYCVLSSGSAGNALWVRGGGVEVLVDCGLSARNVGWRLEQVGLDLGNVQAAVCTHGHGDHVRGAAVLARRHHLDIHATEQTLGWLRGDPPVERLRAIPRGGRFAIGGLTITSVPTVHDAPGSVAFVLDDGETRLGVVTDLGVVTENVVEAFGGLDGLVLEMNHDEGMLHDGPYPWHLKRRIAGERGHLSNRQAADLLARLAHPGLQHLTLAHLSEENNRPQTARAVAEGVLASAGVSPTLAVAGVKRPSEPVVLERAGQLALGLW
jgi:phosphoribosyl 1,2-cyclic phosphodiesterase